MLLVELVALITSLVYVRKQRIGQLFILYILLDITVLLIDFYLFSFGEKNKTARSIFISYANASIGLIELVAYFNFFKHVLKNRLIVKTMSALEILFVIIMLLYFMTGFKFLSERLGYISYLIGVIEFIFLLLPCAIFFYEIINNDSILTLAERPSFWVTTGIFFYAFISIPFYLLSRYFLGSEYKLQYILAATLFNIPYSINFIFLIKAFLCKKNLTI